MTSAVRAAAGGAEIQRTITPVDGSVYAERPLASREAVAGALERARRAEAGWRRRAVEERAASMSAFVDAFVARGDEIAAEITWQVGRPIRYTPGEVRGFEERARHMIAAAPRALADRRRARDRALELSLPHRRQRRRAGADGRQRGRPQALAPDAALRRADGR